MRDAESPMKTERDGFIALTEKRTGTKGKERRGVGDEG